MNPQFWWYVARASGIVAWLMLTASVLWGVVLATRAFPEQRRPAWLLDLHRWLGGLTVTFVGIHLGALVADSYVHFDLVDLLVPGAASWQTSAVAVGVVAFWLLVIVQATSLMMRRLPRRLWRFVHLCSYLVFWLTSLHAALAGTDRTSPLYQITSSLVIVAVTCALVYRLLPSSRRRRPVGRPQPRARSHQRERHSADLPPSTGVGTVGSHEIDTVETLATLAGGDEPR